MSTFKIRKVRTILKCPICKNDFTHLDQRVIPIFIYLSQNGERFLSVEFCHDCANKILTLVMKLNPEIKPDNQI